MANESLVFDILARDGASPSLEKVGGAAAEASGSLKDLSAKLKDINGRTAAARVKLDGDKEAEHELDTMDAKLIRLGKVVSNPNVKLDGVARARADISGLDLALDKLGAKHADASVGVSGAGGAAVSGPGALGGGGLPLLGALGNPAVGIPALVAAIAALPFAAQAAGGAIVTGLGGGLAAIGIIGASKTKAVQRDFTDLKNTAVGAFKPITSSFDTVLQGILTTATGTLPNILGAVSTALQSISGPFEAVGKTIAKAFGDPAVTTSIKAVGTAFGAILAALTPQLPGDIDSIATGITRIANTIKNNPKAFADFIWFLTRVISVAFDGIAALTSTATYIEKHFVPAMHDVANIFDGVRHEIAHTWDQIFENSVGMVIRLTHNVETQFNSLKASVASIWNTIWRNTITRAQNGISDVVGLFRGLPGRAVAALFGLGHSLAAFASSSIGQMWTGFKSAFSAVIHWFQGLPKMILNALGVHSPPGWAIGAGKWIMKGLHIGLGHGLGQLTSFTTSIGAQVAGALSGALGGGMGDSGARTHSAAVAQAYARSLLSQYGWSSSQMSSLIPLWNQESGWNAYAVNPSSGAYGIPQSLGHGHPYNLGDYKNQIIWGLNYIRGRYGSPAAAESHERRFNWYDKGGWLMPGLTLAMNKTGRPERVLPPGQSGTGQHVVMTVRAPHGATAFERALVEIVQKFVIVNGGGDVQAALGQKA